MKLLNAIIFFLFFVGVVNAQSKKEQIVILSNRIDSLNSVINNERRLSQSKERELNLKIDSIGKKLNATESNFEGVKGDLEQTKKEKEALISENRKIENELLSIKEVNSKLQFKLDSVLKLNTNCIDSIQALSESNVPEDVPMDQACTDCNWYAFDSDIYEERDLIFIHKLSVDELYFILCNKSYSLPLSSRKFKEGYTETDMPNGFGTLIFQGDSLRVVYNWANGGHAFGSEGYVEIFRSDKLIKKVYVRSTL